MHVVFNFYKLKKKKNTMEDQIRHVSGLDSTLGSQLGPDCHSKWLWSGQVFKATLATEPLLFVSHP